MSCLRTSRTTPPSPPPMTSTFLGLGWLAKGRWAIISWYLSYGPALSNRRQVLPQTTYENSSRSVHWMTPSRTSTFPYVSDSKTRTSWYSDFSTCRIFLTLRVMACPGHCEEISRNQPSRKRSLVRHYLVSFFLPTIAGCVRGAMMNEIGGCLRWKYGAE